ncbi:hypothetical protein WKV53_16030 [Luteolibacter sp. Y139]|uniref:Uncharacterized protein n=1 Tax=Luteolibacter soli TaxID=3135280 RepID=A0ABU9AYJ9_9BACT
MVSYIAIGLSVLSIALHFTPTFAGVRISLNTPENALITFAKADRGGSFRDLRELAKASRTEEKWPMVDPKSLTVSKVVPIEDSGRAENNGQVMCFISYKGTDGVPKYEVVTLRKNFQGNFGVGYFREYIDKQTEGDKWRIEAKEAWESRGEFN